MNMHSVVGDFAHLLMQQQRYKYLNNSEYSFTDSLHNQDISANIQQLYKSGSCSDINLVSNDGVGIPCHKIILVASSAYFRAMFCSGLQESTSERVVLNSVDGSALRSIIDFMYSSKIEITLDNVQNVATTASLFQLDRLQKECEEFIVYHLDIENCVDTFVMADHYSLRRAREKAYFMMLQNCDSLLQNNSYLRLPKHLIVTYLKDDKLCIPSEKHLFEATLKYVDHVSDGDIVEARKYFDVLNCTRFNFLSLGMLQNQCKNHRYMQNDSLQSAVDQAIALHQTRDSYANYRDTGGLTWPSDKQETDRCGERKQLIMYDENDFLCFNPIKDTWDVLCVCPEEVVTTTASMDTFVFGHRVCSVDQGIALTGGWDGENSYKYCWIYDMADQKWTRKADMLQARCTHGMISIDNSIYVIGGIHTDVVASNTVEKYDIISNNWTTIGEQTPPICYIETCVVGHVIYMLGDGPGDLKLHWYDIDSKEWGRSCTVPFHESQCLIHHDRFIYVFQQCELFRYSIAQDSWDRVKYPKIGNVLSAPVWWNGDIICVTSHWDATRQWTNLNENEKPKVDESWVKRFDMVDKKWIPLIKVLEYQPSGIQGAPLPMITAGIV